MGDFTNGSSFPAPFTPVIKYLMCLFWNKAQSGGLLVEHISEDLFEVAIGWLQASASAGFAAH